MMSKFKRLIRKERLSILVFAMILILILLFIAPFVIRTVDSGQAGVIYRLFRGGTETSIDGEFGEGLHMIYPWDKLFIYDVRIQEESRCIHALTINGLSLEVEISVRFHLNKTTLGLFHKYVGPDYINKVITPEIEAKTRDVIGNYDVNTIYSVDRVKIQEEISEKALTAINQWATLNNEHPKGETSEIPEGSQENQTYIIFENLFIREIILPENISNSIEIKMDAEQKLLTYDYLIQSEEKEKQRKLIEAQGIKAFEDSSGISILKWKGLDVTRDLSRSPNSKLILIGTDEKLPIILNGESKDK